MVVFDSYEERSTKDMTHMRRSKGKKGFSVSFCIDMNLTVTKEAFLNDISNKKRFVKLLREQLEKVVTMFIITNLMLICS